MAEGGDFEDWTPPSEAELKVLSARRERQNRISALMGQYLLKGYKMLGTCCDICGTIILKDKQGVDYCVCCRELSSDNDKDNPVLSDSAAASQVRETTQQQQSNQPDADDDLGVVYYTSGRSTAATQQVQLPDISAAASRILQRLEQPATALSADLDLGDVLPASRPASASNVSNIQLADDTTAVLQSRIQWANSQLAKCTQIDQINSLCLVIQNCLKTLDMLQTLKR